MNFKFAKTLLMGSVISMGAFGLVACGDDSSSGAEAKPDDPIVLPENDASIMFERLTANSAGEVVRFGGSISLDFADTTLPEDVSLAFTGIELKVAYGEALTGTTVQPQVTIMPSFPLENNIVLNEMGIIVNLNDPGFTECGNYNLVVKVTAEAGKKTKEAAGVIPFVREESFCKAPEPSSSDTPAKAEIEMTSYTVNMSTNMAPGLNFATGVAGADLTADLIISKAAGDVTITSGNGTLFAPIANAELDKDYYNDYEVGYWPENNTKGDGKAYVSSWMYRDIAGATIENIIENSSQIYVAKTAAYNAETGAGFYAFAVEKYTEGNNKDFNVTLKVYKAK